MAIRFNLRTFCFSLSVSAILLFGCGGQHSKDLDTVHTSSITSGPTAQPTPAPAVEPRIVEPQTITPTPTPVDVSEEYSDLFGVIEIGSSGIRALVQEIPTARPAGNRTVRVFDPREVRPIAPEDQDKSIEAVKDLLNRMLEEENVPASNVYLVGSSGLSEGPTSGTLAAVLKEQTGFEVDFITVGEEVSYTFQGIVNPEDYERATLIDIGGGNTKAIYYKLDNGQPFVETVRLSNGVRTLSGRAEPQHPLDDFKGRLSELSPEIEAEICSVVERNPAFATRPDVYLTGGMCWILASSLMPPDTALHEGPLVVELRADEVVTWIDSVFASPLLGYDYRKDRLRAGGQVWAEKNRRNVESNFSPAQIAAGAVILRSLNSCLYLQNRKIMFNRDSLYAWPKAYLVEKAIEKQKIVEGK